MPDVNPEMVRTFESLVAAALTGILANPETLRRWTDHDDEAVLDDESISDLAIDSACATFHKLQDAAEGLAMGGSFSTPLSLARAWRQP